MKTARLLAFVSLVTQAACSKPITPAHEVFHLQEDYESAVAHEKTYDAQPDCDSAAGVTCSDEDMREKLGRLDKAAADTIAVAKLGAYTTGYPKTNFQADLDAAHAATSAFEDLAEALTAGK